MRGARLNRTTSWRPVRWSDRSDGSTQSNGDEFAESQRRGYGQGQAAGAMRWSVGRTAVSQPWLAIAKLSAKLDVGEERPHTDGHVLHHPDKSRQETPRTAHGSTIKPGTEPSTQLNKAVNLAHTPRDEHDVGRDEHAIHRDEDDIRDQNPSSGATGTDRAEIFRGFRNRAFPFRGYFGIPKDAEWVFWGKQPVSFFFILSGFILYYSYQSLNGIRGRDQILPGAHRPDLAAACLDHDHGIRARIRSERGIPAPRMGLDDTVCGTRQSSDDSVVDSALGDAWNFQRSLVVDLDRVVLLPDLPARSL